MAGRDVPGSMCCCGKVAAEDALQESKACPALHGHGSGGCVAVLEKLL